MFGSTWDILDGPVEAVVGAIDRDGDNIYRMQIGLSAMQMENLEIKTQSPELNIMSLSFALLANEKGYNDGQVFDNVRLAFEGREFVVHTYNAFGTLALSIDKVRVSHKLADHLGLKVGSRIMLSNAGDESVSIVPLRRSFLVSFVKGMKSFLLMR